MAAGGPLQAKRAFVKVILTIASLYSVRVEITRESSDEAVLKGELDAQGVRSGGREERGRDGLLTSDSVVAKL